MGNAESFGVIRDKKRLKGLYHTEFSGSLSIGKFETIHYDFPMDEPISVLEEIENYTRDIKHSRAWTPHQYSQLSIETFSGSIWSDFVPVIRTSFESESDLALEDIFELLTNVEKIKTWDEYRTNIERTYESDMIRERYEIKYPLKPRKFQDFLGFKDVENGFEVRSFACERKKVGKSQNFFCIWKVSKVAGKVMVQVIRQVELGVRNCKDIEMLYAKFMYLNIRPFFEILENKI